MATGYVDDSKLTAVADAIRAKKGTTDLMSLDQMPTEIAGIGGGDNNAQVDWSLYRTGGKKLTELITTLDTSTADMSKATSLSSLFGYTPLQYLDISTWDTSKVTNAASMFVLAEKLKELTLPSDFLSSGNAVNISGIFQTCRQLKKINNIEQTTIKPSSITTAFYYCGNLESINLSKWDTSLISDLSQLFYGCTSIQSIDLSNWDTSNVTNMKDTFNMCNNVQSIDLSNWDTSNVTNMSNMFYWGMDHICDIKWGDNWASNTAVRNLYYKSIVFKNDALQSFAQKISERDDSPVLSLSSLYAYNPSTLSLFTQKGWTVSGPKTATIEDPTQGNVGDIVSFDGIYATCVYVADEAQEWGQRIYASYYALNMYATAIDGSGTDRYVWGPTDVATGITADDIGVGKKNTDMLIDMNLESPNSYKTAWQAISTFRINFGKNWFVPAAKEMQLLYKTTYIYGSLGYIWTSTEKDAVYATYYFGSSAMSGYSKNNKCSVVPFIYV